MNSIRWGLLVLPAVALSMGSYIVGREFLSGLVQMLFSYECFLPLMTSLTLIILLGLILQRSAPRDAVCIIATWWTFMIGAYLAGVPLTIPENTTIGYTILFFKSIYCEPAHDL